MFVRGADLVVFDDLSSALDVDTEALLWRRLFAAGQRTCLAVSHRREALRRAGEILVLDEGRVIARGDATALLAACPLFQRIWGEEGRLLRPHLLGRPGEAGHAAAERGEAGRQAGRASPRMLSGLQPPSFSR